MQPCNPVVQLVTFWHKWSLFQLVTFQAVDWHNDSGPVPTRLRCGSPDFNMKIVAKDNNYEKAGAELGQAQLKLGLDFILIFCRFGFS